MFKNTPNTAGGTRTFPYTSEKYAAIRETLSTVYKALEAKGYDPINQIVGYILSEDPTYITSYQNARQLIVKYDRDELLDAIARFYFGERTDR
ncbi:MAG: IreB family regulatory phosphoprotein [Clostridia bacterium]|nr:IreB family regulatory phosphoprotein [Clostridia bacterium]MBP5173968.1 IreB family regulatory phosphoprotein [Clostridia bacterium]